MIKTVLFDLGQVIIPFDFQRAYARIEPLCAYPAAEIPARLRSTDLVTRFETGRISPERFVEELTQVLGIRMGYGEFCDLWTSIFLPHTLVPEEFLEELGGRYRLLALSNTNTIHFEMIRERYPLLRHFHDFVLSYKVGAMKPDPAIYDAAIAAANCRPEECFFTDDLLPCVDGARKAGMDAVQFQSFEQVRDEMRLRGLVPAS